MTQPKELSPAYHEAGHCVMAYLAKFEVKGLSLIPGNYYDGISKADVPLVNSNIEKIRVSKDVIKTSLAGLIAQGIHFSNIGTGAIPKAIIHTAHNDFERAVDYVKYFCDDNNEAIKKLEELYEETEKMISENWDMVEGLANELYKQKTLTGNQAVKILKQYTKGRK